MTKRQSEDSFYCELCEKGFDYHSKYARHLQSANHKMFVESLDIRHERPEELSLPNTPPPSFVGFTDKVYGLSLSFYGTHRELGLFSLASKYRLLV